MSTLNILCLGDVVGGIGRKALSVGLSALKQEYAIDLTIVNCENACGGLGLDAKRAFELRDAGIDCITLGDHTWAKKEIISVFEQKPDWIIRPLNYPDGAAGAGYTTIKKFGRPVVVVNLLGRVFMDGLWDCPFRAGNNIMSELAELSPVYIFDFHAEATSEKIAFGYEVDGKASIVYGTHTHVQTADERITEKGTAFITDLGMCGSEDGVIGMDKEVALFRFKTGRPKFYEAARGQGSLQGVVCQVDLVTGKALKITRIRKKVTAD